jgi:hypothetical protein
MAITKLRLGKGSSFVKSRLRRYPLEDAVWEADFQPILDEEHDEFWLGMVIDQVTGSISGMIGGIRSTSKQSIRRSPGGSFPK